MSENVNLASGQAEVGLRYDPDLGKPNGGRGASMLATAHPSFVRPLVDEQGRRPLVGHLTGECRPGEDAFLAFSGSCGRVMGVPSDAGVGKGSMCVPQMHPASEDSRRPTPLSQLGAIGRGAAAVSLDSPGESALHNAMREAVIEAAKALEWRGQSRDRHQSLPLGPGVPPARFTKPDWVRQAPFGVPSPTTRPPNTGPRYPYSDEELQSEIDRKFALYVTLKPGWDTFSAEPVNMGSLKDARRFLGLRPDRIPLPFAQINSDGIVGLYWETDEIHVSVDFDGNGLLSYYTWRAVPDGTPVELLQDDVPFPDRWPDQLVDVLWELRR